MAGRCSCKKVKPADWHEKSVSFADRAFYSAKVMCLLHMPVGLPRKAEDLIDEIRLKEYKFIEPPTVLFRDGAFTGMIMAEIEKLRFFDPQVYTFGHEPLFCFVTEEPWNQQYSVVAEAKKKYEATGKKVKNAYFWYRTCPQCKDFDGYQTIILLEPEA
ncbi:MAG: hypothetical protein C4523_13760 [Myxococcales bacterium]|nr:MAG: hypothetical protein C4523_13760 [Myxococcales bacterium]